MQVIEQIQSINEDVRQKFSQLSTTQLNWKPEPSKWSIGQCLHHLIVSNATYFPAFEKLIYHRYKLSFLQKLNPFKKLMGSMMKKTLGPDLKKKFTAPKIFEPSSSNISSSIVDDFFKHQEELKNYFRRLLQLDTKNLFITSPVTGMIAYSLADALELLVGHEQRHVGQASNILNHPNFPK